MNLTGREKDKLLVAMAAMVARQRLARGVKLNHPEAIALITDHVVEGARDPERTGCQPLAPVAMRIEILHVHHDQRDGRAGCEMVHTVVEQSARHARSSRSDKIAVS